MNLGSPIFQILSINKFSGDMKILPINPFTEKDLSKVKLIFIDNFIYADHKYKELP